MTDGSLVQTGKANNCAAVCGGKVHMEIPQIPTTMMGKDCLKEFRRLLPQDISALKIRDASQLCPGGPSRGSR
jgi:hypothetical protein